jgi:hypothetical protein
MQNRNVSASALCATFLALLVASAAPASAAEAGAVVEAADAALAAAVDETGLGQESDAALLAACLAAAATGAAIALCLLIAYAGYRHCSGLPTKFQRAICYTIY